MAMSDSSDSLQRIIANANHRARYDAHSYFEPPEAIIKFGKTVESWMEEHGRSVTLSGFRDAFITLGQAKLGFAGFVEKVVPKIWTESEFQVLLETLGYTVLDEDVPPEDPYADDPLRVLVIGSDSWDLGSGPIHKALRQLPPSTTVVTNAISTVDVLASRVWEQYGAVEDIEDPKVMLRNVDFVIAFHENIQESKHTAIIIRKSREKGIGVMVVNGAEKVTVEASSLAGR